MDCCQLVEVLRRLSLLGLSSQSEEGLQAPSDVVSWSDAEACLAMSQDEQLSEQVWDMVREHEVSMVGLRRTLVGLIEAAQIKSATIPLLYTSVLSSPHCPILALFDRRLASGLLKQVRWLASAQASKSGKDDEKETDVDGQQTHEPSYQVVVIAERFAVFLQKFGLRDQPDTVRDIADSFCEICVNRNTSSDQARQSFGVFSSLMHPLHGSVKDLAAIIMRGLTSGILGTQKPDREGNSAAPKRTPQAVRDQILGFIEEGTRTTGDCRAAVAALIRHIMLKAPDKADTRAIASSVATRLLHLLSAPEQLQFLAFVARLSRSAKVSQRTSGTELAISIYLSYPEPFQDIMAVHNQMELQATPNMQPQGNGSRAVAASWSGGSCQTSAAGSTARREPAICRNTATIGMSCVAILVQRSSDKSPAVRAKALGGLVSLTCAELDQRHTPHRNANFREALATAKQVKLSGPFTGDTPTIMAPASVSPLNPEDPGATPMDMDSPGEPRAGVGASGAPFVQRKGGLYRQALQSAFEAARLAEKKDLDLEGLILLARRRSNDEKATVRRAGLQLLEVLLLIGIKGFGGAPSQTPCPADLEAVRAATSDPLVSVRKAGAQAAAKLVKEIPGDSAIAHLWVSAVLPLVTDVEASIQELVVDQVDNLIISPVILLGQQKQEAFDSEHHVFSLVRALGVPGSASRISLAQVFAKSAASKKLKGAKAAQGFQNIIANAGASFVDDQILIAAWICLAEISFHSPKTLSWAFLQEQWMMTQQSEVSAGPYVLECIANSAAAFPTKDSQSLLETLLKAVLDFSLQPDVISAHLRALAELVSSNPSAKGWAQRVLTAAEEQLARSVTQTQQSSDFLETPSIDQSRLTATIFTVGKVALLELSKPSARLLTLLQAFACERCYAAGGHAVDIPPPIQAHAWLALGSICLVDEAAAKSNIQAFIDNLQTASSPAVRNNIMVVLADLCIQYTALVDSHIPKLAACLSDPHELVRRQGLALLANLLSKDFVKWRGALFHKFTLSLVDESSAVKQMAGFLLRDTLATKAPLLAYNHFVESIFVLTECPTPHHDCLQLSQQSLSQAWHRSQSSGNTGFPGADPHSRAKRDSIYRTLLTQMAPEHKFATAAKLCQDILGGFADQSFDILVSSEVLRDALTILASKEIKVSVNKAGAQAEEDTENLAAAAKGKVVSAMMRKHLVEGIVPVMVDLKRLLEANRHPLLTQLMMTMRTLLKDHKSEIEDILVADRQFAKELLYDLKQDEAALAVHVSQAAQAEISSAGYTSLQINHRQGGQSPVASSLLPSQGTSAALQGKSDAVTLCSLDAKEATLPSVPFGTGGRSPADTDQPRGAQGSGTPASTRTPQTASRRRSGARLSGVPNTPLADELLREHARNSPVCNRRRSSLGTPNLSARASPACPDPGLMGTPAEGRRLSRLGALNPKAAQTSLKAAVSPSQAPSETPALRSSETGSRVPMTVPKLRQPTTAQKSCLMSSNLTQHSSPTAAEPLDHASRLSKENQGETAVVVTVPTPLREKQRQWNIADCSLSKDTATVSDVAAQPPRKTNVRRPSRLAGKRKAVS